MTRFARWMAVSLAALSLSIASISAARAQNAYCALNFTTMELDYTGKQLRVIWRAEGPAQQVALQIFQNGTIVDPDTLQDWRHYDLDEVAQAVINVANLQPGAFFLQALMLDENQVPCKAHDGNLYVANVEMKWDPPSLEFEIIPNVPDYAGNAISAQVHIPGAKQDVMYYARLMVNGQIVGSADGIGKTNPFVIEIPLPRSTLDLRSLKEAMEVELTVSVGYSAAEMVSITQKPKISPMPAVGLMERIGNVVLAVLNNLPIVMAILLVLAVASIVQSVMRPKKSARKKAQKTATAHPEQPPSQGTPAPVGNTPGVEFHTKPAVRARIVQNGDRTQEIVANIDDFPFVFGRNKSLDHGQVVDVEGSKFLNLRNDREISRRHIQLVRSGRILGINVLSSNEAIVNERTLKQSETAHLSGTETTVVQIGEQTTIELKPIHLI